ncbi:MAG: hypothetical protein QM784_37415 [Polyangiaceae bacterium]
MTRVLVVAGTASGVGKTSITLALARAYTRRGLKVRAAKVGPDYLDPMHLTLATGRPCINLDSYMMGRAYVLQHARRAASGMDLLIVEGVMGLFNGVDPTSNHGSTAEMAQLLDANVVLVVDAHAMARSFAATVQGYCQFERGLSVSAVIANRVGSASHGELLGKALASANLPRLVAAIPEGAFPKLASRHLGLVAPTDIRPLDALADAAERHFDLDAHLATSKPLMALSRPSEDPTTKSRSVSRWRVTKRLGSCIRISRRLRSVTASSGSSARPFVIDVFRRTPTHSTCPAATPSFTPVLSQKTAPSSSLSPLSQRDAPCTPSVAA